MKEVESARPQIQQAGKRYQQDDRRLRLAQLILTLKPGGGAETLVHTLAKGLKDRPVELHVISLRRGTDSLAPVIRQTGAQVLELDGHRLFDPVRFWQLLRYLRRHQIDVIHTHLTGANILGLSLGRLLRKPVVVTLHNSKMQSQQHRLHSWLESRLLRQVATRVIAVGWLTAAAHQERVQPQRIEVIPNAVPDFPRQTAEASTRLRQLLMQDPTRQCLLAVGRLNRQKGYTDLIAAMKILRRQEPNYELLIAGNGPQQDELKAQIKRDGLERHVKLLGLRRDIPQLMQIADLFVSASRWEGLPVAVLEAMASGLPMVITEVGDIGKVVPPDAAWLVRPGNPNELAAAIASALRHPESRAFRAQKARAHVIADFGVDEWVAKLLNTYHDAQQS